MNWYYKLWVGAIQKAYNNSASFKSEKDKNFQMLMTFSLAQLFNIMFIDCIFIGLNLNFHLIFISKNFLINFLIMGLYFQAFYLANYFLIFYKKRWMHFNYENKENLTANPMVIYIFISLFSVILFMFLIYFIRF
jgi:hypothetical protein